ncbi:related to SSM4-involved in mRNA turnover [Rhynchosporium agropyri]|uniref:RING-type E3 ubiquitin transferase n=1 Tax=Rhynchosporium agropyri TaxID=914238 RepID=A0A1E1K5N9_9HELO|nr:related to SSM4-involved in mRNA turnover [Rhynchosporium agropyri]
MADTQDGQVVFPDLMNDPQYTTNFDEENDGSADADTCRICRAEGTDTEALFHPCKCSGSIKFVHQDCLMEWLSHSQKKHCELCKTPFRFTKLYSPNMSKSLPLPVLLRHVVVHSIKNVATWLRFCVVAVVWLGCLPFVIRQVWRLLFWFSDGGWPQDSIPTVSSNHTSSEQDLKMALEIQKLAKIVANGTSPVTPLQDSQTTSAHVGSLVEKLMEFLAPVARGKNISDSDPLIAGLLNTVYYALGFQNAADKTNITASLPQNIVGSTVGPHHSTLLGDVRFLRNLTRNSHINQLVITIAEGYVITLLVVVCFILVFLIREWVVQQQPGINVGAGFNAEFAPPERARDLANRDPAQEGRLRVHDDNLIENGHGLGVIERRPIAQPRRENNEIDEVVQLAQQTDEFLENLRQTGGDSAPIHRPAPIRDALTPAAEIQRAITEEPRMTEEFLAIWRRADNDPLEVLRIIEREDKSEQMRYWVNAMKLRTKQDLQGSGPRNPSRSPNLASRSTARGEVVLPLLEPDRLSDNVTNPATVSASGNRSRASSESWEDVESLHCQYQRRAPDDSENDADIEDQASDKGKGKAVQEPVEEDTLITSLQERVEKGTSPRLKGRGLPTQIFEQNIGSTEFSSLPWMHSGINGASPSASRPRAISDGPQPRDTISPLANNSWSFSNLDAQVTQIDDNVPTSSWSKENRKPVAERDLQTGPGTQIAEPREGQSSSFDQANQGWKDAQDRRVQRAFEKAREARGIEEEPQVQSQVQEPIEEHSSSEEPLHIVGQDGLTRGARNWDEVFDANPVESSTNSEAGLDANPNNLPEDAPLPAELAPVLARPLAPQGFMGRVADFLWGGVNDDRREEDLGGNDEHIVQDMAAEAPFVPVAHHDHFDDHTDDDDDFALPDPDAVEAAIAAGLDPNDPDAMDEVEDFEGIMELVGMRGPIFSLVQNALFSAFLLALTVSIGVWIPYNIGRVSLLLTANPGPAFKLPLRFTFGIAAFLQDVCLSILGLLSYATLWLLSTPLELLSSYSPIRSTSIASRRFALGSTAIGLSHDAVDRILNGTQSSLTNMFESEMFAFSAASHESLILMRSFILNVLASIGHAITYIFTGDYHVSVGAILQLIAGVAQHCWALLSALPALLAKPDSWVISLEVSKRAAPLNPELSVWDGTDRFWAVFAGYTALFLLGALYVKKGSPFSTGQAGREWEATVIDLLNQAGGVMKVILIISIEMLVFPLYCGLLLDGALLPLFEQTTIMSRIHFTIKSPLTSIFVHWFVGTCYMFHFALFVSMCRKIMRKGVLYFIRDPDDPTFHPVRDVLERNVATQLRKILFSALVYGGLVVICLGGVVWGLAYAFKDVLPIHWSSNEPVLEFPIDLLFYNFLMPLAVKFFKPSDGLHAMYSWWFRRCARMLRLTWFMFDERKQDEEGYNVRRTWKDIFKGTTTDSLKKIKTDDIEKPFVEDPELVAYFRMDGRYVRAPASDQVRIPKNMSTFLEVNEANEPLGSKGEGDDMFHSKKKFKQVYLPPRFRTRIFLFILSIWLFAALTGVSITILPLVLGRYIFAKMIPTHVRKNDVYAFSIGIYILGSLLYAALHVRQFVLYIPGAINVDADTPQNVRRRVTTIASRVGRITWTYTAFLFILPTLFSFLVEFYLIVPLHTYFAIDERHVMHFVQSWTLGLLYVKLTTRIILWYEDSRPAQSLRAIIRNGYLDPDARLATRSFILPVGLALCFALFTPWCFAKMMILTILKDRHEKHTVAYRYAYPMCLSLCFIFYAAYVLLGLLKDWRMTIRDEVYLIGERLHNFGDRKAVSSGVGVPNVRRIDT